jgi:general secretion pathway protein H
MQTLTSAIDSSMKSTLNAVVKRSARKPSRVSGFTLLEVLVVVTLLALFASMTLPMMSRNPSGEDLDFQAQRLRNTVQMLAENSLFRGQLLALRVSAHEYQPLGYDVDERQFLDILSDEALVAYEIPQQFLLEWQLADDSSTGEKTLAYVAEELTEDDASAEIKGGQDKLQPPQMYFFPSGESTPITLLLRDSEESRELRIVVDAAGRVVIESDDDEAPYEG